MSPMMPTSARPFRVNAMPWAASYREKSAGVLAD
jgi:hypothetical protein